MGAADVIPGVSGGTIALIVGIYRELIRTLNSLHLRWIKPLGRLLLLNAPAEQFKQLSRQFEEMNFPFLVPLGAGILSAIALGSTFIPSLLSNYPVAVKALFFGLILASAWIPFQIVDTVSGRDVYLAIVVGIALAILGFFVSNPNLRLAGSVRWVGVESGGATMKTLLESVPSSKPAHRVYWSQHNQSFRAALKRRNPALAERLRSFRNRTVENVSAKKAIKARSEPYETIRVPSGLTLSVPRLSYWYVFFAGMLAITAMILPGISGSYILLILGSYFFVLNSVKGFLDGLLGGLVVLRQGLVIVLFAAGALVGLLVFTRVLEYLLDHWQTVTAAGLSGLMIGCLRGVWPFQRTLDGTVNLMVPAVWNPRVSVALVMFGLGVLTVFVLTLVPAPDGSSGVGR